MYLIPDGLLQVSEQYMLYGVHILHCSSIFKNRCNAKVKSTKFYSLSRPLQSEEFLMNLALMCDALSELRDLSLALQDRYIDLV